MGAIGNGMELLALSGSPSSPEMELIRDSLRNAMARVQFFRIAFGPTQAGQTISRSEILDILQGAGQGGRINYDWKVPGNPSRALARTAFLIFQCLETAMPRGGSITIAATSCGLNILAAGEDFRIDPALWDRFGRPAENDALAPAMVQFALLPQALSDSGHDILFSVEPDRIKITVALDATGRPDVSLAANLAVEG